jgi:hypothetical protein
MINGVQLTLLVGPVLPVPVPKPVLDALTKVTVTIDAEARSAFQLDFSISNNSPLQTIFLIAGGQTPLLRVIIVATINGIPNVLIDGVMTRAEIGGGGSGPAVLTVTGEDLTKVMDMQDLGGLPYPALPDVARVALILAKYAVFGIVPMVIPPIFPDFPIPVDRIPTHEGTDLHYIVSLGEQNGYVFYIEPGPVPGMNIAYWGPQIKIGVPQPALNMDMDAYKNVESMNFSFNSADNSLPIVMIQNALTKFPLPLPIPKLNPLQPPLGLISSQITNLTVLRDTAKMSVAKAISSGLAASSGTADAVSASGSLDVSRYGRVLQARKLVGVRGAGTAYNGLYYVKKVTSTIQRGEFKQNFELTRNGIVSLTPVVPV